MLALDTETSLHLKILKTQKSDRPRESTYTQFVNWDMLSWPIFQMKFGSNLKVKAVKKNATEIEDLAYIVETLL